MSNYSKIVNYANKDALTTGDPNKKILGAQIDAEFVAISTAITSKEDTTNKGIAGGYAPLDANGDVSALGLVVSGSFIPTNGVYLPGANTVGIATNSTLKISVNANGTVTIAQPAAGNAALIASAVSGGATEAIRILSGAAADSAYQTFSRNGTVDGFIGAVGTAGNLLASSLQGDVVLRGDTSQILFGNTTRGIMAKFANAGNFTLNAPSSGVAATITGIAGGSIVDVKDGTTTTSIRTVSASGQIGTTTNNPFQLIANSIVMMNLTGTAIQGLGPTAAAQVDMTPDTGSFTATQTGGTTAPTVTAVWARMGNIVACTFPGFAAMTSNSTALTITGLPAAIQPARQQAMAVQAGAIFDAGAITVGTCAALLTGGTLSFTKNGSGSGFTNSATSKGSQASMTFVWHIN